MLDLVWFGLAFGFCETKKQAYSVAQAGLGLPVELGSDPSAQPLHREIRKFYFSLT